jgi:hypothetical protein
VIGCCVWAAAVAGVVLMWCRAVIQP